MNKKFNFEKEKDLISGIFFCVLSILIFIATCNIRTTSSLQYGGSKLLPWIASGTMFLCSLFVIASGVKKHRSQEQPEVKERKVWRVAVVFLLLIIYIFAMSRVGFLISTIVFLFGLITFMARKDQRSYWRIAVISVVTGAAIYLLFTKGFKLALPMGKWL